MAELKEYDFLNPAYVDEHADREYIEKHRASLLAYRVHALISTAWMAHENDGASLPLDRRGVADTLETARAMLGDLISDVEQLEKRKLAAKTV